jgi:hypothetical protein
MIQKLRFVPITDPQRIAAIKAGPKYREYWEMHGDVLWLLKPPTENQSEGGK